MKSKYSAIRGLLTIALAAVLGLGTGTASSAVPPSPPSPLNNPTSTQAGIEKDLLAKAAPDECFDGIGQEYPSGPPCASGVPKVNQAYVWGLAKIDQNLFFGTAPNVHCLVIGQMLGIPSPMQASSWVCEFGESRYSPPLPAGAGDWRAPHLYLYSLQTRHLTEITPSDALITTTLGIRSAGTLGEVVILGGPSLTGGINLYAYNGLSGEYLGSANLPAYTNIRKWLVVDNVLYTAVRSASGGGRVLRWTGSSESPFKFQEVGRMDSEGAELALFDGRLYVTTWPDLQSVPPKLAGLYMSPPISNGGLTGFQLDQWEKVWEVDDYEPDLLVAATYGGGALTAYNGYLYWGTMHVPFAAAIAHFTIYGSPANSLQAFTTILNRHRAISLFRGRGFGTSQEQVELLYGEARLMVYTYDPNTKNGTWSLEKNKMGVDPLWGSSGFGNFYNNYLWTMAVYQGKLYLGTMDYSYLFRDGLAMLLAPYFGNIELPPPGLIFPSPLDYGADLWRIPATTGPAEAVSLDGIGNYGSYGIRTMLADDALYLGMANPMNLMTDPTDAIPEGGWELLRLLPSTDWITYLPAVMH